MRLTDAQIDSCVYKQCPDFDQWHEGPSIDDCRAISRDIESAATAPLLKRIAELEANEKVLLAQVQGHTEWRERIIKASEQAYSESAIRYKFSLTKSGKCMNTFPREIDGRWFALVPAEDDGHIGHIARIAELEKERDEWKDDAINGGNAQYLRERVAERYTHVKNVEAKFAVCKWNDDADEWWPVDELRLDAAIDAEKEHP
jgi:hypothetical protein